MENVFKQTKTLTACRFFLSAMKSGIRKVELVKNGENLTQ